ncbi:MAG: hypothetical protein QOF45_470 [Gaiellaceae bacterium]|jgi:Zn-dependent protease|nr:hypothetical protein [Gaiellaceae bacterium]
MSSYDPYQPHDVDPEHQYSPVKHGMTLRDLLRRLWAPIAGLGAFLIKFGAVIFKLKVFTTAGTMLVSVGAYALFWGWKFAVGFVLLLLVHELGHVLEAKRQGLPVSAPMFIPFLGAVITLKRLPDNVWAEAKVAIAGPIIGSLGAAAFWAAGVALNSDLLTALAFTGFLLNLFNLAPISPLDGGRIAAAIHPALWALGLAVLVVLAVVAPNPILILILILGALESWRRWRMRRSPEAQEYYRVSPTQRVVAGVAYVALAALLSVAMAGSHIQKDI